MLLSRMSICRTGDHVSNRNGIFELISKISVNAGVEILYKIYQRLDLLGNSMRGDNLWPISYGLSDLGAPTRCKLAVVDLLGEFKLGLMLR